MPDIAWNKSAWEGSYDWSGHGEEWSRPWISSRAQWYGSLLPRVSKWLPSRRILEIAPGFGRWTRFLINLTTENYAGVDLSQACIDGCNNRFKGHSNASFFVNDGMSLDGISADQFDFVFSFDSLVHAEFSVFQHYIPQILAKLSENGVAFIHHANASSGVNEEELRRHLRATNVCSKTVKQLIESHGGAVIIQEEINWRSRSRIDCLTTFCLKGSENDAGYRKLENDNFMAEAYLIANFQSAYSH
jgi:SAM-dependent methyltransferase